MILLLYKTHNGLLPNTFTVSSSHQRTHLHLADGWKGLKFLNTNAFSWPLIRMTFPLERYLILHLLFYFRSETTSSSTESVSRNHQLTTTSQLMTPDEIWEKDLISKLVFCSCVCGCGWVCMWGCVMWKFRQCFVLFIIIMWAYFLLYICF